MYWKFSPVANAVRNHRTKFKLTACKACAGDAEGGEGTIAGAKTLCCPFEQPAMPEGQQCIFAEELLGEDRSATQFALWGRSY